MAILQKAKSIRAILTFWYSLVLVAALSLFGYGVFIYLKQLQEDDLRKTLVEEVDWIASLLDLEKKRFPPGTGAERLSDDIEQRITEHFVKNPRNFIVILTNVSGDLLFQSPNLGGQGLLRETLPSDHAVIASVPAADGGMVRVAGRYVAPFAIQVAYPEQVTQTVLSHLLSIFLIMVPVALFLSITGGWFLAGLALRPVRQISRLANIISAENLTQRIPPRPVNDELGELIHTINTMIERLQASFENMRQFSMSVAHELKTPLTILQGESELALMRPMTGEEAERLATTYLEETVRMSKVVSDLLLLAKADAQQITLEKNQVDAEELMRELYEDAQILSAKKHLTVVVERIEPVHLLGDATRLRQMLRAILANAVTYTDPDGTIRLASLVQDAALLISIEDTGIGIPPEHLDKIFERFYRVDEARSRAQGGSGLGLAIAKWIAEAHRGSITVNSNLGAGSRFTVRLPLTA